jgi:hypothetical protein
METIFDHRIRGVLKVIRLPSFDPEQVPQFSQCGPSEFTILDRWVDVCKAEGVRLEFEDGELVEIGECRPDPSD